MCIDNNAVKPRQRAGKIGKIRAGQKRDLGLRMRPPDFMKRLKTKDQIAQSTQADDQNMFFFRGHFCSLMETFRPNLYHI